MVSKSPLWETGCMTVGRARRAGSWRRTPGGRSASMSMCRSAPPAVDTATSTPIPPPSWAARTPTAGWPRCAPSWPWPPTAGLAAGVGPFSSVAAPLRCSAERVWPVLDAVRAHFALAPGAEVTTEANPESTSPRALRAAARGRLHQGVARHAVDGPARAGGAGPGALARPGARGGRAMPVPPASSTSTST